LRKIKDLSSIGKGNRIIRCIENHLKKLEEITHGATQIKAEEKKVVDLLGQINSTKYKSHEFALQGNQLSRKGSQNQKGKPKTARKTR
jgi:hypothetical protein